MGSGYEVHLVARHSRDEVIDGIHLHSVPTRKSKLARMMYTIWNVYRKAVMVDAELYHFHDPELIPIGLLLKLQGKKAIYDVHEDYPDYIRNKDSIPRLLRKPVAWITGQIEKYSAGFFDAVIVVTPKIFDRFKVLNASTVEVYNFPFTNELSSAKERISIESRQDAVAYIGDITRDRGIQEMVQAIGLAQWSKPVNFIIGGTFAKESLENEIRRMPEFRFVDYRGFLSRKEVADVLSEVKVGLVVPQPFSHNKFGYMNKLFEYMSAGIPVIASDFPAWRPIVRGTQCGLLVNSLNPEAIAEAILYILDNPEEAEQMGKRGRKAVEEKYNWDNEKGKLLELYADLLR